MTSSPSPTTSFSTTLTPKHNLSLTTTNHPNTVSFKNTVKTHSLSMTVSASSAVIESSKSCDVVDVELGDRSYPIYIGSGLLNKPDLLQSSCGHTVAPLYLDKLVTALTAGNPNVTVESVILPDGENYKDMDTLMKVFDKAIESRLDRRCTFVALGGGVIGDMCGYAAA
ncbi:3-dehydroquinate synthase, chloroplastic, partial [Tanacetum coccineum]